MKTLAGYDKKKGMGIKRTSHSVYDTSYQVVWTPKYRKKLFFSEELREYADEIIREIGEEYGIDIAEMEIAKDHIHLLVSFPPSRAIGEVVRVIKRVSAREIFKRFPQLRKKLWSGELWEAGYFVRTVGDKLTRQTIERYIRHHREQEQGSAQLDFKLR